MKKQNTSVQEFSLKPTHIEDPVDSSVLFGRKDSYHSGPLQDDSPLPTSALPYIYNQQSDSPSRSVVSTSIFPPMESENCSTSADSDSEQDNIMYRKSPERAKNEKKLPLPSASDMIREAAGNGGGSSSNDSPSSITHETTTTTNQATENWRKYKSTQNKKKMSRSENKNLSRFSVRITTSQSRADPCGSPFTSYVMCVETADGRYNIEHRYSDFSKLYNELKVNGIVLKSRFPMKSLAGRIGDWTPSLHFAPEKNKEMIRNREKMLDGWMMELCETFQQSRDIHGELRKRIENFLQKSSTAVPPCDRENHIAWDGFLDGDAEEVEYDGQMIRAGGVQKFVGNPISFTLRSSIRQAAYTVMHMCGTRSTLSVNGDQTDQSIPLDLLQNAKGLVFLTVAKAGLIMSVRGGTGLMIARKSDGSWTPPVALGTMGVGWGALIGGDITNYMIVLNTERAVKIFAKNQSVNLGAELGVAVGPIGRAATGNVNAGTGTLPAPAYAYAHSKGLFAGISFEGSVVACRPDANAKFYGRQIDAHDLLFENVQPRPKAAQPLYETLNEAMRLDLPDVGFRPSEVLNML